MNCREARRLILLSVEQELREDQRRELEEHVRACASCARARRAHELLAQALRASAAPAMPRSVAGDVLRAVRAAPAREVRWTRRVAGFAAVLAGVVLLLVAVLVGPRMVEREGPALPTAASATATSVVAEIDDVLTHEHAAFSAGAGAIDDASWLVIQAEESARLIR